MIKKQYAVFSNVWEMLIRIFQTLEKGVLAHGVRSDILFAVTGYSR